MSFVEDEAGGQTRGGVTPSGRLPGPGTLIPIADTVGRTDDGSTTQGTAARSDRSSDGGSVLAIQTAQNDTSSPRVGSVGNMLMPERVGGELSKL